jgi:DNA-binding CsgD family transcriptional regulator
LSTLVGELYAAATDAAQWQTFLASLSRETKSVTAHLAFHDPTDGDGAIMSHFGLGPEAVEEYPKWAPRNVYLEACAPIMHTGSVVRAPVARRDLLESPFHRDFVSKHVRACDSLGICIVREGETFAFASVMRALDVPDYGADESEVLHHLVPHLQRAFEIHRRLAEVDLERSAAVEVLDRLPTAIFLLADDRRVLFHNAAARHVLARSDALALTREGRLTTTSFAGRRDLERAIAEACLTGTGRGTSAGGAFRLSRCGAVHPYAVVVSPLGVREAPFVARRPAAVVLVDDPDRPPPSDRLLQKIFGLTPAQAALTALLAGGESLDGAADRLAISRNTARWTLKHIFLRTGTSRQSELVRLIGSTAFVDPSGAD